jgi:hypothetical protein
VGVGQVSFWGINRVVWEASDKNSRPGKPPGSCSARLLDVCTVRRKWIDWLDQDKGRGLKASWNNGFGSPVFCSGLSLPV